MDYLVTPQDYLNREKDRLLSDDPSNLFYAALELRCCVESRQADYLEALEFYRGSKIKHWQVGHTSRKLGEVWKDPKIAQLTYKFADREFVTYFTPVKPPLARAVEKELGALLHAQTKRRMVDDNWWQVTRRRLVEIYREAWIACRGEHMAPPLWNAKTRMGHPMRIYGRPETAELIVRLLLLSSTSNKQFVMGVDYFDEPPSEWDCDL